MRPQSNIKFCLYRVWCPHCYPKRNIDHGNFGNTNLGALSMLVGIRTERRDVHFLRLFSQFPFVMNNSSNNVIITKYNDHKRHAVIEYEETASVGYRLLQQQKCHNIDILITELFFPTEHEFYRCVSS